MTTVSRFQTWNRAHFWVTAQAPQATLYAALGKTSARMLKNRELYGPYWSELYVISFEPWLPTMWHVFFNYSRHMLHLSHLRFTFNVRISVYVYIYIYIYIYIYTNNVLPSKASRPPRHPAPLAMAITNAKIPSPGPCGLVGVIGSHCGVGHGLFGIYLIWDPTLSSQSEAYAGMYAYMYTIKAFIRRWI